MHMPATGVALDMGLVVATSITQFSPAEWNALFPGELEDWAYYHAVENARLADFEWLYFGVRDVAGLRVVVPAFVTEYRLDTTLEGRLRRVISSLSRAVPALLCPRMLSLGSPVSEGLHAGFAADAGPAERERLFATILEGCEQQAALHGARMIAIKDASNAQSEAWLNLLRGCGLRRQPGLPSATLALPFDSVDAYLASLSRATRKNLRRKLRTRPRLRVEWRANIDGISNAVAGLYQNTLERAAMQFEELTPAFFANVLSGSDGRARCVCYWLGDELVAFNLVLVSSDRLIDKYIGMDYRHARELNLYYVSWMENVRFAIEHGIPLFQSGQGLPEEKLRLGSTLSANWLWYRHRNRLIDGTLKAAEHALGLHRPEVLYAMPRRRQMRA
jgi:hypothetical protein